MAVKTFTGKANLWNQIKQLGFDSKQLKSQYDITYQQANVYLLYDILKQLQGEGVKEDLGTDVAEVTGNDLITDTNAPINQDKVNSSEVNYIVTLTDYPQVVIKDDYNPKELTEVTEEQLLGSLYTDKVTAEMMFPGSYYQVLEVNPNNIKQQLMQHYNLEATSTIVATVTSDNITEFKGIPVEHFETMEDAWYSTFGNTNSDYLVIDLMTDYPGIVVFENISEEYTHSSILNTVTELKQYVGYSETYRGIEFSHSTKYNYTGYVDLLPGTVELKLGHYNFVKLANKKSLTAFEVSTMLDAVKQAKKWLGVNTVKVPSTEEAIQPSPLERKSIYA